MNPLLADLGIDIHVDSADLTEIRSLVSRPYVQGITTNPTLMRRAGVTNYETWAREVLEAAAGKAVSFEVIADDPAEMVRQARRIAAWGDNVLIKIPIRCTGGLHNACVLEALEGLKINFTAITSGEQVRDLRRSVRPEHWPAVISVFAGRISDSGKDPEAEVAVCCHNARGMGSRILWASTREVYNVVQARRAGASIITMPPALLAKMEDKWGRDMDAESLDVVKMFAADAISSGLSL